jgi:hypothetical protein
VTYERIEELNTVTLPSLPPAQLPPAPRLPPLPSLLLFCCPLLGLLLGLALRPHVARDPLALAWIALPGDLAMRALQVSRPTCFSLLLMCGRELISTFSSSCRISVPVASLSNPSCPFLHSLFVLLSTPI